MEYLRKNFINFNKVEARRQLDNSAVRSCSKSWNKVADSLGDQVRYLQASANFIQKNGVLSILFIQALRIPPFPYSKELQPQKRGVSSPCGHLFSLLSIWPILLKKSSTIVAKNLREYQHVLQTPVY